MKLVGATAKGGGEADGTVYQQQLDRAYIAEAIAWSENDNHAKIYTVGLTAEEAEAKLMEALGELKLLPEMSKKGLMPRDEE